METKIEREYYCKVCDTNCDCLSRYNRHLKCINHIENVKSDEDIIRIVREKLKELKSE
jgi:hypothetical protein